MTNTSPLEVHYKWYFLRRPPVRRQDPEQVDEGVDMQSECETDSLTEGETEEKEEGESGEEGEEEEEEEEEEGRESGREEGEEDAMEQQQQEEREIVGSEERGHEEDMPESKQGIDQAFSGRESQLSSLKQDGSGGEGSMADLPAESLTNIAEQKDDRFTASDGKPEDEDSKAASGTAGEDTGSVSAGKEARQDSKSAARVSREKQPWELVDDPFTPLSIEQVSRVGSSSARGNKSFVYYCTFQ